MFNSFVILVFTLNLPFFYYHKKKNHFTSPHLLKTQNQERCGPVERVESHKWNCLTVLFREKMNGIASH